MIDCVVFWGGLLENSENSENSEDSEAERAGRLLLEPGREGVEFVSVILAEISPAVVVAFNGS